MQRISGIRYDDGRNYATNSFPVHALDLSKPTVQDAGWAVAYRRRYETAISSFDYQYQFDTVLSKKQTKPVAERMLSKEFLLSHCCVSSPRDVCTIDISGQQFTEAKSNDLKEFCDVAYINASENLLPIDTYKYFESARELELVFCGLRTLEITECDFPHLQVLDISYNNISNKDVLRLGSLHSLRVLNLAGNNLQSLPAEMSVVNVHKISNYFLCLEQLVLRENALNEPEIFACLAGLQRLKELNMIENGITTIPLLYVEQGKYVAEICPTPRQSFSNLNISSKSSHYRSVSGNRRSGRNVSKRKSAGMRKRPGNTHHRRSDKFDESLDASKVADEPESFCTSIIVHSDHYQDIVAPFPSLTHLNIANNKITAEHSVLNLADWPLLSELIIYNNPLISSTKGCPPLINKCLVDNKGVTVIRSKPQKVVRPPVCVPHSIRKIDFNKDTPSIQKPSGTKQLKAKASSKISLKNVGRSFSYPNGLCCTKSWNEVPDEPRSASDGKIINDVWGSKPEYFSSREMSYLNAHSQETEAEKQTEDLKQEEIGNIRQRVLELSWKGEDDVDQWESEQDHENIFITEVPEADKANVVSSHSGSGTLSRGSDKLLKTMDVDSELLLKDDEIDDDSLRLPTDFIGSVNALKNLISCGTHDKPLPIEKDTRSPPQKIMFLATASRNRARTAIAISNLQRSNVSEKNLSEIMEKKAEYSKEYKEALKLLNRVQQKYHIARNSSIKTKVKESDSQPAI